MKGFVVEHLPGKLEALGSMLSTTDTLKKKKKTAPMFQAHQPDTNQPVPPLSSLLHTLSALPFPGKHKADWPSYFLTLRPSPGMS